MLTKNDYHLYVMLIYLHQNRFITGWITVLYVPPWAFLKQ